MAIRKATVIDFVPKKYKNQIPFNQLIINEFK